MEGSKRKFYCLHTLKSFFKRTCTICLIYFGFVTKKTHYKLQVLSKNPVFIDYH